ncbi:dihydrolipoyllysine-residue succinyltransferase component of 2-oxoglutarate dehydrogenase complex 2, mitochondrial-like isoform X1 [Hibiscus syriacus]|uniref:dihydrolipoyllysine-residue succinyltransferase component of 2-oxoglutarate dehydrogenase complex 2, mitochondrial-like isoform X1 n=1 Tax=Hibiscus syriacus TaxID=106335 RepID=UPI001922758F|nr:dihydrolipoyllysine-residue succinyltransferase component of 2-oxoglutarate dehydrogenase complex 2, mitochondrial-like isoform X1 [Hibiscus syriacus]XP_039026808.1 dihydrolipoyllysine-residue succinyltransferase component of 2-oxoglutarate dehydrogenase complex 2, mitochondrial-like isoform X1 [Hibiscus syriacus]XP_039026809.1 dihydrolipoyllysine-residue succinyltransferase component of 2-oxoglutarate dehydrogenase complex 2, mitochondrial-like isoform X1 [Hibiscus syriacus]
MLGALRRKVATGGSSVSVLGKSIQVIRPNVSASRVFSNAGKEILLLQPRGIIHVRYFSHLVLPGCSAGLTKTRDVISNIQSEAIMQKSCRAFSSGDGDLVDAVVPFMGESITDGTLATFLKKPGDRVAADEPIAQIETDKVTIDVVSPHDGVIQEYVAKEGDTVEPGVKIAVISKSAEGVAPSVPAEKKSEKTTSKSSPPTEAVKEDKPKAKVEASPAAEKSKAPATPPPKRTATEPVLPPKERERRVPMTRLRKRVATRLKDSQNTFAMLTTFNEVDMTNLMKLRSDYKDAFVENHGVKLGFMSGFVKAAVSALQHQPIVNAVIDGDDIIYRDYIDISIAVGTPKGLVVPVVRDAGKMNFAEIEKTINSLAKKATDGTISIDEMAGGSFTISNGGVYGSLLSTPIINPPQSAILGMHSIVSRPMVVGGNVVPRPMMYIALTYDHRLIDGREAVFFLRRIKDVVEDPRRLLLDV